MENILNDLNNMLLWQLKKRAHEKRMDKKELKRIKEGKSIFKTETEYHFYKWFSEKSLDFVDDYTLGFKECGLEYDIPQELISWAEIKWQQNDALDAGIPLSVLQGKTKMRDHFPKEEAPCEHDDIDKHYCCLNCGKDMGAEIIAEAYDKAKDFRKYGQ